MLVEIKHIFQDMKLNRCYKPRKIGKVGSSSLHYFFEASEIGYGKATYVRLVNVPGKVLWKLVIGKSCVIPLTHKSIPRLELAAAVLSTKTSILVKKS